MRTSKRTLVAGVVAGVVVGGVAVYASVATDEGPSPADLPPVSPAASARYPSVTAQDWVTYADHVAVVTVAEEVPYPLDEGARTTGEGMRLREVTFEVDRVLWSSPEAPAALPESFSYAAYGWVHKGQPPEQSRRMVGEHSSRLEPGHTYVFAFDADPCPSDPDLRWRGLGAHSHMPADGGVVGNGEYGSEVGSEWTFPDDPRESFRRAMVGEDMDTVARALNQTRPVPVGQRPDFAGKDCGA